MSDCEKLHRIRADSRHQQIQHWRIFDKLSAKPPRDFAGEDAGYCCHPIMQASVGPSFVFWSLRDLANQSPACFRKEKLSFLSPLSSNSLAFFEARAGSSGEHSESHTVAWKPAKHCPKLESLRSISLSVSRLPDR
jgi:hypothetical protein